jgi:secreted PhoX family phosphatase
MYKFVTKTQFDKRNRSANFGLLDEGVLYVAQFNGPNSQNSTFETPTSVWPDGHTPPRPSVIVVTKNGRGSKVIGS